MPKKTKKTGKPIPTKSKQTCENCSQWKKTCASPGGHCSNAMFTPKY